MLSEKKGTKLIFDKLTLDSIEELECLTRFDVEKGEKICWRKQQGSGLMSSAR
jgi:hypothetical protein